MISLVIKSKVACSDDMPLLAVDIYIQTFTHHVHAKSDGIF